MPRAASYRAVGIALAAGAVIAFSFRPIFIELAYGYVHVAILGALGPLTVILTGWLGLDETMTWLQLLGVALVLGGVVRVSLKPKA